MNGVPRIVLRGAAFVAAPAFLFGGVALGGCSTIVAAQSVSTPRYAPGAVINVRESPYNAKGDGITDDTDAIKKALRDAAAFSAASGGQSAAKGKIVYLPAGVYKVSDTIELDSYPKSDSGFADNPFQRIEGESAQTAIIKLAPNTPGFTNANEPKPVVSFLSSGKASNTGFSNYFENVTVQVGRGNAGAIAVRYHASNSGALRHAFLQADAGAGFIGLDLRDGVYGPALIADVHIKGFQNGVFVRGEPYGFQLEDIFLRDFTQAGIRVQNAAVVIRGLQANTSFKNVPAVVQEKGLDANKNNADSFLQLVDATLTGTGGAAIDSNVGQLFLRNISANGYGRAAKADNAPQVPEGKKIAEYATVRAGGGLASLNLPDTAAPAVGWDDPAKQADVEAYGAKGDGVTDDTDAVERALKSGKPAVFFRSNKSYLLSRPLSVPAAVRRINGMFARLRVPADKVQTIFRCEAASPVPLLVERVFTDYQPKVTLLDHATKARIVIVRDVMMPRGQVYKNSVTGGTAFVENASAGSTGGDGSAPVYAFDFNRQTVWGRHLNPERGGAVRNVGGTVYLFGVKTEFNGGFASYKEPLYSLVTTTGGGTTELLGGWVLANSNVVPSPASPHAGPNVPLLLTENSRLSASVYERPGYSSGGARFYSVLAREVTGSQITDITRPDNTYPQVPGRRGSVIPLYISRPK